MLGHPAYADDMFEDDVSPVMVMEIHLFQEALRTWNTPPIIKELTLERKYD